MREDRMQSDLYSEEEINIDLRKYWLRIKSHWKPILWITAAGFVLGCLIALDTPHKYVATSRLAPELSATATNRLSTVASLVGLTSAVLGTTDAVYPMVYPDVVHSPEFVSDLFGTMVTYRGKDGERQVSLYDYVDSLSRKSVIKVVAGLPGKALDAAKGLFSKEEGEPETSSDVEPFHFTKKQWEVYKVISKAISAEIDKKTLIVTLSVMMDDNVIAAETLRAVNSLLKEYVSDYRTDKAVNDRDYYKKLYEESQQDYREAQRIYAHYVDSHQGMVSQSAQIERDRLRDEMSLKYQLYTSMAQQLQGAEAKVQQETPVFAEIVTPTVPLKSANSRKKMALAVTFLAFCLGAVIVLWKYRKEESAE